MHQRYRQTERQTDGQTDRTTVPCSVGLTVSQTVAPKKRTLVTQMHKDATIGGLGGPDPQKFGRTTPTFYAAADCSARNWVYRPYFVMYSNLDQGIGPQL